MSKLIIFMGVAGAGKSVQGRLLAEKIGFAWISTGELLRAQASQQKRADMLQGKLISDGEIIAVIDDFLTSCSDDKNIILDGFPRTLAQAQWLLPQHQQDRLYIEHVINLQASKEVVKERLLKRGRPDDNEEAISLRFLEYEKHTLAILDWFKHHNFAVHDIKGDDSVENTHQQIIKALGI